MKKLPNIINKAKLAREMFPDNAAAPVYLDNKLKGRCRAKLTDNDKNKIVEILLKTILEIRKGV